MSASSRVLLVISVLAALGLICLFVPFILLSVAISPPAYPGAVYIGTRPPALSAAMKGDCFEALLVNRWSYQSPDDPSAILHWFQAEGWLANYRYSTATLLQSTDALNTFRSTTFRDVYINKPGSTTLIVATTQYTLAIGSCIPNPSGIPIP